MSTVYAVGCNFRSAELDEQDWNDWYNGPKMAQMLALPLFENVQRFRACALDTAISYLAVWLLDSAEALSTPEYVSTWGFDKWAGEITDWTRDLIDPLDGSLPPVPLAGPEGLLRVAWFDSSADLDLARREAKEAGDAAWWWGENSGLDRSFGYLAISAVTDETAERAFTEAVRETIFRPISKPGRVRSELR